MRKLICLILLVMPFIVTIRAEEKKDNSSVQPILMETHKDDNRNVPSRHRAPFHISINAWYNPGDMTININYEGEAIGEVYLNLNGMVIDYSSEINSIFQISSPGLYEIEIVGESWTAYGYLHL